MKDSLEKIEELLGGLGSVTTNEDLNANCIQEIDLLFEKMPEIEETICKGIAQALAEGQKPVYLGTIVRDFLNSYLFPKNQLYNRLQFVPGLPTALTKIDLKNLQASVACCTVSEQFNVVISGEVCVDRHIDPTKFVPFQKIFKISDKEICIKRFGR